MALQVWLPLDGDLRNQGLADITVNNNSAIIDNNGKIGKCYSFGTGLSYLEIPAEVMTSFTTEASIAFWIKFISWNKSYATVFQAGATGVSWAHYIFGFLRNNAAQTFCFTISNGSSASNANYLTPALTLNTWYHITCTYSPGHCKIYINGDLYQDYITTIIPNFANIARITIGTGNNRTNGYQTNILLNDFRIYNHALSAKEVKELSKGLILHYRLSKPMPNILKGTGSGTYSSNSYANGTWGAGSGGNGTFSIIEDISVPIGKYSWNITGNTSGNRDYFQGKIPFELNKKYTASWWAKGNGKILFRIWDSTSGTARVSDSTNNLTSEWTYYTKTFTANQNMVDHSCNYQLGVTGSANINICGMKLEEGEIATIWIPNETDILYSAMGYDSNIELDCAPAGNQNDGTIVGTITTNTDSPRYKTSYYFNGASYFKVTSPFGEIRTISLWAKWDSIPSGQSVIFVDYKSYLGLGLMSSGILCSSRANSKVFNKSNIVANTWYHFVIICPNGSTNAERKLYINGQEQTALTGTSNWSYSIDELQVGKRSSTNDGFKGKISDFRVYCTVLSAEDILELYNTAAQVDKDGNVYAYEFKE